MRRAMVVALLAVLVGLVAGCGRGTHAPGVATAGGGKGASPKPTASADPEQQRREFSQCMREHGIDLPDPDPNGGPVTIGKSAGPHDDADAAKMDAAIKACQQYMPTGNLSKPDPEQLEQARQYAKCMRDHGVDMPDPDPNGGGGFGIHKGTGGGQIDPDEAKFKAATEACKDKLPKGGQMHTEGGGQ
jgi:hypothetical protein